MQLLRLELTNLMLMVKEFGYKVYPMSRTNRNTDEKISKVKWDRALHRMMVCPAKDKRQTEGNGKTHLARALPTATDNDHCYNSRSNHQ